MPQPKDSNHRKTADISGFRSTSSGTLYKRPSEIVNNREVRALIEKVEIARRHQEKGSDPASR